MDVFIKLCYNMNIAAKKRLYQQTMMEKSNVK